MPWPPLTRPRQFVNPVTLVAFAVLSAVYGAAYIIGDVVNYSGESLQLIRIHDDMLPGVVYGGLWLVVAVGCFVGLYSRRAFKVAYSGFVSTVAGWSLLYLCLWCTDTRSYGLLVSSVWWAVVAVAAYTIVVIELTAVKKAAKAHGCPEYKVR